MSDGRWGRPLPRIASCPGTHPSIAPAAPRTAPLSSQSNKIEKAVSAAHTFLQKNPKHEMTLKYLNYYRTMVDVDEYLVDLEAQPYEVRRSQAGAGEEKEEEHPQGQCVASRAHPKSQKPFQQSSPTFLPQKASLGPVPGMELCPASTGQLWELSHPLRGWARGLEPSGEVSRALSVPTADLCALSEALQQRGFPEQRG